jgi:hypothetical protein
MLSVARPVTTAALIGAAPARPASFLFASASAIRSKASKGSGMHIPVADEGTVGVGRFTSNALLLSVSLGF